MCLRLLRGASYSLHVHPDNELDAYIDSLIDKIAAAQEEDGYLYTNRTINPDSLHAWVSPVRWETTDDLSHELYNLGHLYEAAAAHYAATGKRNLLDLAIKSADLVYEDFGWGKLEKTPGHQVIEIGLAKLYRITGDVRYLDLAKFFLDVRGPEGESYSQAHQLVVDQTEAVGHAVRAAYMYAGMADIAALTGNEDYIHAIDRIWEDVVSKKLYVTGGIGSTGSHEGFGPAYEMPNFTAYNETCASIANVYWNHRLFLLHGDAKYIDVLERTLYNALSSGLSLSGDRFFYPNPLEARKNRERSPWFNCACCPSNMARFLPSIPGYQYAQKEDEIFVNLFAEGEAELGLSSGKVTLTQRTNYPWDGQISLTISTEKEEAFAINIRIPGWARNEAVPSDLYRFSGENQESFEVKLNGEKINSDLINGYFHIERVWKEGDEIHILLPMPIRKIIAHEEVEADQYRMALQRGPLVYCLEGQDQPDSQVIHMMVPPQTAMSTQFEPELLNGIHTLNLSGNLLKPTENSLEQVPLELKAIPYYAWANRGRDYMMVWLPYDLKGARPMPSPTIAYRSSISTSDEIKGSLTALNDQVEPKNSNDHENPFVHWWPHFGTQEWIEYKFDKPTEVSSVKVYWFDDAPNGGCRIPASWQLLYKTGNEWKPVKAKNEYLVTKDTFDELDFESVKTSGLRLEVQLQEGVSAGLHEWIVQ